MAVMMGIGLLGLVGLFLNWYAHTVRSLEKSAIKASQKRASKVKVLASSRAIYIQPSAAPKLLVAPSTAQSSPAPAPKNLPASWTASASLPTTVSGGPTGRVPSVKTVTEPTPPPPTPYVAPPEPREVGPPNAVAEKRANAKLSQARRMEKEGKARLAAKLYQQILDQFPETEAAKIADGKGTLVMDKRIDKAEEQFAHAQQFERTNSLAEAKAEYAGMISRYPETEAAKKAKERLAVLNKK
jgi:hypothetical protein